MKDKTKVTMTEVAPDPKRITHDENAIQALVKQVERLLKAKEKLRRNTKEASKAQSATAEYRKAIALKIAARLKQKNISLRLPGQKNSLARLILHQWPEGQAPSIRTLRRWLSS
jgi:hypothetical protein